MSKMKLAKLARAAEALRESMPECYTAAVILAAGSSSRMGGGISKQLREINGIPVLAHTLLAYQKCPLIREIVVVARAEDLDEIYAMHLQYGISKMTGLVVGGSTRQESAKRGVERLGAHVKYVAVADGARCLVTPKQIAKVAMTAYSHKAAAAGHKVQDTLKRASVTGAVCETVDRTDLWQIQTPQIFHTSLYHAALAKAEADGVAVTDDAGLIEHLGYRVHLVECGAANMKITTPEDLPLAEAILTYREGRRK